MLCLFGSLLRDTYRLDSETLGRVGGFRSHYWTQNPIRAGSHFYIIGLLLINPETVTDPGDFSLPSVYMQYTQQLHKIAPQYFRTLLTVLAKNFSQKAITQLFFKSNTNRIFWNTNFARVPMHLCACTLKTRGMDGCWRWFLSLFGVDVFVIAIGPLTMRRNWDFAFKPGLFNKSRTQFL